MKANRWGKDGNRFYFGGPPKSWEEKVMTKDDMVDGIIDSIPAVTKTPWTVWCLEESDITE